MQLTLIGVAGPAGAGKDSIASWLVQSQRFTRVGFADPIKDALELFEVPTTYLYQKKEAPIPGLEGTTARKMMQTLGTEWGRMQIHPDLWVRAMAQRVERLQADGVYRLVIPDVRFENEAAWVRSVGALWHVNRPDTSPVRAHVSEQGISPLPGEPLFRNDGDLDDLFDRLDLWIAGHPALAERLR